MQLNQAFTFNGDGTHLFHSLSPSSQLTLRLPSQSLTTRPPFFLLSWRLASALEFTPEKLTSCATVRRPFPLPFASF